MSTTLVQSFEDLIITANTRLTAEIQAEKDPKRLESLLALAYRTKVPRVPPSTPPARPAPAAAPHPVPPIPQAETRDPQSIAAPPSSPSSTPDSADEPDDDTIHDYTPMTQEQVEKLQSQIGFIEANRRRLIHYDLAYKTAMRKARLAAANSS